MMPIKLITLTENTANYGCLGEWGLSILVEAEGKRILLDTGLTDTASRNAASLRVDLKGVDYIILSHGHKDHTGGLKNMLANTGPTEIIAHPDIWKQRYSIRSGAQIKRNISLPYTREQLEQSGANFTLSREPAYITENILTTGEVPLITNFETIDETLYVKEKEKYILDTIPDDLSLIINTRKGLILILGCGHRGVINIIRHAQKITGKENIYAVIGGIHLFRASAERIEKTVKELKNIGIVKLLGVCHCTGFAASMQLAQALPDIFFTNYAGDEINLK
jgi:7,8-dihydropterin-6-yl-methyl-4-(beta-D-ribofuranosyl)aminobenzene 5'-phosphate synthase